jgi:hypothetical protein
MEGLKNLLGFGTLALSIGGLIGDISNAGTIRVRNRGPPITNFNDIYLENISGASEGYGFGDSTFTSSPYSNALETYTMVEGHKLSTDARSIDTLGWDFFLGVKGLINYSDNRILYNVSDITNLGDKNLFLYDVLHPETKYGLLKDFTSHEIILPALVNQPAGAYAHWRLDVTPSPEPSSALLAATGAIAVGAWTAARYLGRRKEDRETGLAAALKDSA